MEQRLQRHCNLWKLHPTPVEMLLLSTLSDGLDVTMRPPCRTGAQEVPGPELSVPKLYQNPHSVKDFRPRIRRKRIRTGSFSLFPACASRSL